MPGDELADDKTNQLVALGYSLISVRQMTATRLHSQRENQTFDIPLLLMTLTRNDKPIEIFKLISIGRVVIKVVAYRAREV